MGTLFALSLSLKTELPSTRHLRWPAWSVIQIWILIYTAVSHGQPKKSQRTSYFQFWSASPDTPNCIRKSGTSKGCKNCAKKLQMNRGSLWVQHSSVDRKVGIVPDCQVPKLAPCNKSCQFRAHLSAPVCNKLQKTLCTLRCPAGNHPENDHTFRRPQLHSANLKTGRQWWPQWPR